jgi:glucose-1-phosphatase
MKFDAVIFDFGGVLFEIDYDAPVREFSKLGFAEFKEAYSQANQEEIFDLLETGKIPGVAFYDWISRFMPSASRAELEFAWNSILLHLLPERMPFIHQLREAGYKTYILSNTNELHARVFEKMIDETYGWEKFASAFDTIHYSQDLHMRKPHPETFLHVCSLHDLAPKRTVFIDDSIQHVKGALEAGLHAFHLKPTETPAEVLGFLLEK